MTERTVAPPAIRTRPCRESDLDTLDRIFPSPSVNSFHRERYRLQTEGAATYLIGWAGGVPIGHALIKWDGCADAEVRRAHPDCPEINGLVVADELRSRGVGSLLIGEAERWAVSRGRASIGLGVADVNPRARALYERLGYAGEVGYLDRYTCVDSLGTVHRFADPCVFLVRALPRERMGRVTS
ncbi:GNAT family N-acetyltransferase [Stackebrandtia soli]|uniref:GNAT family N-acetyltransferase n=1 Tax=Stackebrandtia soli TaxID=1892856 RepID=UPI0039EBF0FE